jgi:hypothetical protein
VPPRRCMRRAATQDAEFAARRSTAPGPRSSQDRVLLCPWGNGKASGTAERRCGGPGRISQFGLRAVIRQTPPHAHRPTPRPLAPARDSQGYQLPSAIGGRSRGGAGSAGEVPPRGTNFFSGGAKGMGTLIHDALHVRYLNSFSFFLFGSRNPG